MTALQHLYSYLYQWFFILSQEQVAVQCLFISTLKNFSRGAQALQSHLLIFWLHLHSTTYIPAYTYTRPSRLALQSPPLYLPSQSLPGSFQFSLHIYIGSPQHQQATLDLLNLFPPQHTHLCTPLLTFLSVTVTSSPCSHPCMKLYYDTFYSPSELIYITFLFHHTWSSLRAEMICHSLLVLLSI